MRQIHLILQGKGGVGKSLSASILCQYLLAQGKELLAIDTDPVNQTLTGYKALPVQKLELCLTAFLPYPFCGHRAGTS